MDKVEQDWIEERERRKKRSEGVSVQVGDMRIRWYLDAGAQQPASTKSTD